MARNREEGRAESGCLARAGDVEPNQQQSTSVLWLSGSVFARAFASRPYQE